METIIVFQIKYLFHTNLKLPTFIINKMLNVFTVACVLCGTFQGSASQDCQPTITTVTGTNAPTAPFCAGQLIWSEEFNDLNEGIWKHELGGNYVR